MLLAMVDRAAQTPTIRAEMESTAGESEARRLHASSTKRANAEWEAQKKKLGAERVTCKTATDTKNNKAKVGFTPDSRATFVDCSSTPPRKSTTCKSRMRM